MDIVWWRKLLSNREQFWGARRAEMSTRRAVFSKAACGNQLIMSICFAPFPLRRQTRFGKGQKVAGNGSVRKCGSEAVRIGKSGSEKVVRMHFPGNTGKLIYSDCANRCTSPVILEMLIYSDCVNRCTSLVLLEILIYSDCVNRCTSPVCACVCVCLRVCVCA